MYMHPVWRSLLTGLLLCAVVLGTSGCDRGNVLRAINETSGTIQVCFSGRYSDPGYTCRAKMAPGTRRTVFVTLYEQEDPGGSVAFRVLDDSGNEVSQASFTWEELAEHGWKIAIRPTGIALP